MMMWVVEEFMQTLREMLLEGNIHNIVVFTVITSSSVLSVVGMLRHIYIFIYNLRHGHEVGLPVARGLCPKVEESQTQTCTQIGNVPVIASLEKLAVASFAQPKYSKGRQHSHEIPLSKTRNTNSPTCLKCDREKWERHCVYGLCDMCCQKLGGCQQQKHRQQPTAYNPWPNNWHKSERVIDLSHLYLYELPSRLFFHHMDGYSLNVSYNCLSCLPEHVALMRGLVSLSLRHNLLSNIPAFFASLHQLAYVDLRNNRLSTFPDSLLELPQLLKLYLDHNCLSKLPCDIDRLHFLQCLSLGYNDLSNIPDYLFNIQSLKSLNLRGNHRLSVLPGSIGNLICLQRLDVSHCDLRLVPASLSLCTFLRKCNISYNRLTHLPCEISQCYRLTHLDVSSNRLTFLPATLLYRQRMLVLLAGGNKFLSRQNFTSKWLLLDAVPPRGHRQVPTLTSLSGAVVDKHCLNASTLPVPIQEELSSISSCYHCGEKKVKNGLRAVKFRCFRQRHPPATHHQLVQAYPFMYTFCLRHLFDCRPDTLESCVDSLSRSHS